jgi:hypothetical protein
MDYMKKKLDNASLNHRVNFKINDLNEKPYLKHYNFNLKAECEIKISLNTMQTN